MTSQIIFISKQGFAGYISVHPLKRGSEMFSVPSVNIPAVDIKLTLQALLEDASLKQRKWLTSTDCYTLCQVRGVGCGEVRPTGDIFRSLVDSKDSIPTT